MKIIGDMRIIASLIIALSYGISAVYPVTFTVSSCDELAAIDGSIATESFVTNDTISCDSYLRFVVRNETVLKSSMPILTFSNMSFMVYGSLKVGPDVVLTGVSRQVSSVVLTLLLTSVQCRPLSLLQIEALSLS